MWLRSTPIRKAVVGSVNPVHAPVVSGPWQTERSPNPIPRAGVKTSPTPFFRSNARNQPPRSTVFLFPRRSEEHTSELQSRLHLVCRLLLEKKKNPLALLRPRDAHPDRAVVHLSAALAPPGPLLLQPAGTIPLDQQAVRHRPPPALMHGAVA